MSDGEPGRIQIRRCLYRKSDSAIMVMKSAEDGRRYDAAHVLDGAMDRRVLVERPMRPQLVIIDKGGNPASWGHEMFAREGDFEIEVHVDMNGAIMILLERRF